jgi:hypothetical protein
LEARTDGLTLGSFRGVNALVLELTNPEPFGAESILRICTFQRRSTQSRRRLRGQSERFAPNLYRSVASLGISVYNELTEYICIGLRGGSLCRQQVIS